MALPTIEQINKYTKKDWIKLIKAQDSTVTQIGKRKLSKALVKDLKALALQLNPEVKAIVDASEKKEATPKQEVKEEPKADKVEKPKIDVDKLDVADLMQIASKMQADALKHGKENKEEITKPKKKRATRKSKWSDTISTLLLDSSKMGKDGVYRFSLQEVIDLTGLDPKKNGKLSSWVSYGGDWKPTYKGVGKAVCLLGFKGQVSGAPGANKDKQSSFDLDENSWELRLTPFSSIEEQVKMMEARKEGVIKNWVYTQSEIDAVLSEENDSSASAAK
jgi:hypothetical protein